METQMNTITKILAFAAVLSALAVAPASARFDGDDSTLSAYATFGGQHHVDPADVLVNRPIVVR
jgi:hypothetical protein